LPLFAAAAVAACGGGTPASAPRPAHETLPAAQLVSIARRMAAGLGDPHVRTAWVLPTSKNAAENATDPGAVPPERRDPRAYFIMIRGRFVCRVCSRPLGAKAPRGKVAYDIWVPGRGITDSALEQRIPHGVSKLGPMVRLDLGGSRALER
jgi:hypothetical protein